MTSYMANHLYQNDLPDGLDLGSSVAIDCETMGLVPGRDRLCLVQLSNGDGNAHLVQIAKGQSSAPNLQRLIADPHVLKLFHFGRFDIAALYNTFTHQRHLNRRPFFKELRTEAFDVWATASAAA